MILCVLDSLDGRLCAAIAGHPLPLVLRGQTVVPVPDVGGPPVAAFGEARYEEAALRLEPGDRVFLFTDGFVEQTGHSGQGPFGQDRLTGQLRADRGLDLEEAVARAVNALAEWAGGRHFADDVSLVAIEWLGPK